MTEHGQLLSWDIHASIGMILRTYITQLLIIQQSWATIITAEILIHQPVIGVHGATFLLMVIDGTGVMLIMYIELKEKLLEEQQSLKVQIIFNLFIDTVDHAIT